GQIDVFDFANFEFGQVGDFLIAAQHHELHAVGDKRLEDVVAVSEHFADRVIGFQHRLVAGLSPDDGEFARPGKLCVVGINLERAGRRLNVGNFLQRGVTPVQLRAQVEGAFDPFVALRIVNLELFTRSDRAVVPVVDTVAIEVRLANLRPELTGAGSGVGIL